MKKHTLLLFIWLCGLGVYCQTGLSFENSIYSQRLESIQGLGADITNLDFGKKHAFPISSFEIPLFGEVGTFERSDYGIEFYSPQDTTNQLSINAYGIPFDGDSPPSGGHSLYFFGNADSAIFEWDYSYNAHQDSLLLQVRLYQDKIEVAYNNYPEFAPEYNRFVLTLISIYQDTLFHDGTTVGRDTDGELAFFDTSNAAEAEYLVGRDLANKTILFNASSTGIAHHENHNTQFFCFPMASGYQLGVKGESQLKIKGAEMINLQGQLLARQDAQPNRNTVLFPEVAVTRGLVIFIAELEDGSRRPFKYLIK